MLNRAMTDIIPKIIIIIILKMLSRLLFANKMYNVYDG